MRNLGGRLEVFYVGTDNALYHNWQDPSGRGGWRGEASLGGSAKQITVGQNSNGSLEAFYVGTNDALYHNWQDPNGLGGWHGEESLTPTNPTVTSQCVKFGVSWYGGDFAMDENCTAGLTTLLDYVNSNGVTSGITAAIGQAVSGGSIGVGVMTTIITALPVQLEHALKSADQGNGTTLHVSVVVWGLAFVGPGWLDALKNLVILHNALDVPVGGNFLTPFDTVLWVTRN